MEDLSGGVWCYSRKGVLPFLQTSSDKFPWDDTESYGICSRQLGEME